MITIAWPIFCSEFVSLPCGLWSVHVQPSVNNLVPQFVKWWDQTKNKSSKIQIAEFKKQIVPGNALFYENRFQKWKVRGKDVDNELKQSFETFPQYEVKFRSIARRIGSQLESAISSFKNQFPDFKCLAPIFILHSLGELDGGTRRLEGQLQLIFGVDGITQYQNTTNQLPFFHHELFHVYHEEKGMKGEAFYHSLWSEGLATYVSEVLNPGSSAQDLLLDLPKGLMKKCEHNEIKLWNDISSKLQLTNQKDYETYFYMDGGHEWIVSRAGYCLGYKIARSISQRMSLEKMIQLRDENILSEIKSAIEELIKLAKRRK